ERSTNCQRTFVRGFRARSVRPSGAHAVAATRRPPSRDGLCGPRQRRYGLARMPATYGGVDFEGLPTRDQQGALRAVIETPRGSIDKIKYDPDLGVFRLERPLPGGIAYPYDWGFFPSTRAADGDPLDVMVVHDATSHPGLVIPCHPLGVLQVTQKRKVGAGRERNDRIVAVPVREYRRAPEAIL